MDGVNWLWPWSWWAALAIAVAVPLAAWASARLIVWRSNRNMGTWTDRFRDIAMSTGDTAFSIMGKDHGVVVSGNQLAVLDLRGMRVLKSMKLNDLAVLKIYEDGTDQMQFRIVTRLGGQTRRLATQSIVEMAKFFDLMTQRGVPIEYIQE
jgi:hypothetical protein